LSLRLGTRLECTDYSHLSTVALYVPSIDLEPHDANEIATIDISMATIKRIRIVIESSLFHDDIPMLIDFYQLRETSGRGKIIQHDSELRALRDINRKTEVHSSVRRGYSGPTESRIWLEVAAPLKRFKKASGRA